MRRVKLTNMFLVVSLVVFMVLTGCSNTQQSGSTSKDSNGDSTGGTITIALPGDITSLDPVFAYDFVSSPVVYHITEGMLKYDEDGKLIPNLAEKWEALDDKTYVYHLRKDVTFSDGSPMTADDVIFSMNRARDPKTAAPVGWMYDNVDKIEKEDDLTVKVTLKTPDASWQYVPATSAGHIISKKYYEENAENFGKPEGGTMGTGPFKYVSWQTGSEVVLEKNENYWNKEGGPYIDKVVLKVVPEGITIVTGLKTGQINMTFDVPHDLIEELDTMDNVIVDKTDSFLITAIEFNTQRKPFDDVKVRQAMNYALDKEKIMEQIIKDQGSPSISAVPPALWTFAEEKWEKAYEELPDYSYDIEKAKKLMAESSVPDGFKATILTSSSGQYMNIALALRAAVKPLGIDLEIDKQTDQELDSRTFSEERDYDIAVQGWGADFPDASGNLLPLFHSSNTEDGGANYANYRNPEVDKLLDEQNILIDDSKRAELMIEAQKIIAEDSPWIFIAHDKWTMATTSNIEGYSVTPLWYESAFLKDVKIK